MTVLAFVALVALAAQPQFPTTGDGLYRVGCANCHGADGRGADPSTVGFDTPLPDFTDCSFATREADLDWMAVTHDGGPARGFSTTMPAFGEAFNEDQIQLILDHIRGFCSEAKWPRGELNMPLAVATEKAYPEDEVFWVTELESSDAGQFQTELVYEKRFGALDELELSAPFTEDGFGNFGAGWKHVLFHSLDSGTIVSVLGEVVLPTASESDEVVFEPTLLAAKLLPSDGFLQCQLGFEIPEDIVFWRAALGKTFTAGRFGRSFSPMVEVLGEHGDGGTDWDLLPQMQVSLNRRQHILADVGFRVALNDRELRSDAVVFYVLWDWFDGGLFDGW